MDIILSAKKMSIISDNRTSRYNRNILANIMEYIKNAAILGNYHIYIRYEEIDASSYFEDQKLQSQVMDELKNRKEDYVSLFEKQGYKMKIDDDEIIVSW